MSVTSVSLRERATAAIKASVSPVGFNTARLSLKTLQLREAEEAEGAEEVEEVWHFLPLHPRPSPAQESLSQQTIVLNRVVLC